MKSGAWIDREGPLHALALVRIVVALAVFRHAVPFFEARLRGDFYADHFYVPYAEWIPQPGPVLYDVLLFAMLAGAAMAAAGYRTRTGLAIAAVAATWHLALNQLWFSNNKLLLVICLAVLALSHAGRAFSLDALRAGSRAVGQTWTASALRGQVTIIYLASAGAKLLDPAWRSGDVMYGRVVRWELIDQLPERLQDALASPAGHAALGLGPIALEMFLAVGLHARATRRAALWVGLLFHGVIEALFHVLVFSQVMAGLYLLFASDARRDRVLVFDPARAGHRRLALLLASLDWLEKLEFRATSGAALALVHEHRRSTGLAAAAAAAAAVPLLFPVAYPFAALFRGVATDEAGHGETDSSNSRVTGELRESAASFHGVAPFLFVPMFAALAFVLDLRFLWADSAKVVWAGAVLSALLVATSSRPKPYGAATAEADSSTAPVAPGGS